MYSLFFERSQRVLITRVSGSFGLADLIGMREVSRDFVAREGAVRFLIDTTAVESVDFTTAQLVGHAQKSAVLPDAERVYVAPNPEIYGLTRMFGTYQRHGGNREPLVVHTLAEAHRALDLVDPDFQSVIYQADGGEGDYVGSATAGLLVSPRSFLHHSPNLAPEACEASTFALVPPRSIAA